MWARDVRAVFQAGAMLLAGALLSGDAARARVVTASWYYLPGNRTANGELYDARALTAASRTLPFGTKLVLCSLDSRSCVNVRVNDRGPFIRGRELDVTPTVARRLGILRRGVARVEALG